MKTKMHKLLALLLTLSMVLSMSVGIVPASAEEIDVEEIPTETVLSTDDQTDSTSQTMITVDEGSLPASIELDNIRVQLLSDRLVRIEVKGSEGFEDRSSFTVQKRRGWDAVPYTSETLDGFTVISTSAYKVYIPEGAQTPDGCYVTDLEGNTLWNYESNTNSNVYLPSPSDELNSWYFTDTPRVIPSENGYCVTEDYEDKNGWDMSNDATDLFVFLPQGNYENFTSDFVELTGSSEMVTLKMLGYWDSRWYAYNEETALKQIQDYLDRGYPIDMLVIDTDWRTTSDSGIGYDINTELFPDMARFLERAHEMGVSVVFNDHPEPADGTTNLLDKEEIEYRNNNLKRILSLGLDSWWYDRNWTTALNPIHDDLSIYTTGQYAFQQITEDYYESIADVDEYACRALIMANVDGIKDGILQYAPELASHRYSIQWSGDILCEANDLKYEIFNAIYGGVEMGIPYISADIGGHKVEVSDDMYVRWVQFGSLSPVMRVHCTKPYSRMPWLYGETAEAVTHTYVDMRYRLLPIYYTLAHENYETGLPLLRRLDINYPQYAESADNYQYLLGDTILVAPMTETHAVTDDFTLEADGQAGLKAEYYNNNDLSGSPVVTKYDQEVNFDWGQNGPDGVGVQDNFSVRWTGNITIGEEDACIRLFADDGVRVWIDDEMVIDGWNVYDLSLTSDVLEAGSTHSIKIEYFDSGSYAHIYMSVITDAGVDHQVFLPEGEWMDIWTGKTYAGPATVTVNHKLETSPIFVRMGAALTLADNMKNVDEKDWSHMTLDVYPSISHGTTTTLYEDDTTTVGYKSGQFRTTDITLSGKDKTVDLLIEPAKGSFTGDRACTERNWTIRVHGRDDWGELTGMTLNGEAVDFTAIAKDENAQPLAIIGGCRDNVVYEVSFKAAVAAESKLSFVFENTCADGVNDQYDDTKASFTASVESLKKSEVDLNLTAIGNKDWALFGAVDPTTVYRKNVEEHLIGEMTGIGSPYGFNDNYPIAWQDGDLSKVGSSTNGPASNHSFEVALKADKDKTHYEIYLGGYQSVAKLTIRDRAGNVKTYTFGDMDTNYYRKVVIDVTAEEASEIYIGYSMLCGNNITFSAVAASDGTVEDVTPDSSVGINVSAPYTTKLDLTAEGTKYWEYYGQLNQSGGSQQDCKANATDIIDTSFQYIGLHWDNKAEVTWSDGAGTASATTRHGLNSSGQTVTVTTEGVDTVKFLVGAYNAKNQMTIYDKDGILLESQIVASAGDDAQMALVSLDLSDYIGDIITVTFTAIDSNGGNVSLTAVTASESTAEDVTPDSGVKVNVSAPYTTKLDLTAEGTQYWEYYGQLNQSGGSQRDRKANATDIIDTSFQSGRFHWDNKAEVTWSDGLGTASVTTLHGMNGDSQTITVTTEGVTTVKFLVGAYNAKNRMTIYDKDGVLVGSQIVSSAGSDAQMALVSLDLSDYVGDMITVVFTAIDSNDGNVSLTAVTASNDTDEDPTPDTQKERSYFTADFNEQTGSELFDFYTSSDTGYTLSNDKLTATGSTGEYKAIYKDNGQPVQFVSVELHPDGETGKINGGLYINASEPANGQDQINALYVGIESHFEGWDDAANRLDLFVGSFPTWTEHMRVVTDTALGNNLFSGGIKEPITLIVDIYGSWIKMTVSLVSDPSKSISAVYEVSGAELSLGKVGIRSLDSDVQYDNFTVVSDALAEEDVVASVGERYFASVSKAAESAGSQTVCVLKDTDEAIQINGNVTIDLAGKNLSDVTVAEGASLKLVDSAATYEGAVGSATVTGTVEAFAEAEGTSYITVAENGVYTAHCYDVALTHISLNPAKDALGYKAKLYGDAVVQSHVQSFGFNLWVDGGKVKTYGKTDTDVVTLRLQNIMAANGGEMGINAEAFVTLVVGEETFTKTGDQLTTTMKQTIEKIEANLENNATAYSAAQIAAVQALIAKFEDKMTLWNIDTIQAWTPAE